MINSKDLKPMSRFIVLARKGTWVKSDLTSLSRLMMRLLVVYLNWTWGKYFKKNDRGADEEEMWSG